MNIKAERVMNMAYLDRYYITGKRRLIGEVSIGGCKNAILPILAATVLTAKRSIIHNCPPIADALLTLDILRSLGADVAYDGDSVIVDTRDVNAHNLPTELAARLRASSLFLGALIGRGGAAQSIMPGGCKLGKRPVDLHINAFRAMGVDVHEDGDELICRGWPKGAHVALNFPSVGATQNVILAATLAKGKTIIENAAKEPEIVDLQNFLNKAGAKISGAGSPTITIRGVKSLNQVEYTIMPDRIVAGTYLCAAAITGGHVKLNNTRHQDLAPVIDALEQSGSSIICHTNSIQILGPRRPMAIDIHTGPHPAFPTDMQPQFTSMLTIASGQSHICESIFESRDRHIKELQKLGAKVTSKGDTFIIKGQKELMGAELNSHDLRGGASLIIAALAATGESVVHDNGCIPRGYADIAADLQELGACILYSAGEGIIHEPSGTGSRSLPSDALSSRKN